jgi:hypothetical protein
VADYDAAQDLQVVGDNITFAWLIKNSLTQYVGKIQFVIEFIGTDYVWKSKICTFKVQESLSDTGGLTPAPTDQWYNTFVVEMDAKVAAAAASAAEAQALIEVLAPEYSSEDTYEVGDYVVHSSRIYKCNTAITTPEAWTAAHWTAAKLAEDVSDVKSGINYINDGLESFPETSETVDIDDFVQGLRHGRPNAEVKTDSDYITTDSIINFIAGDVLHCPDRDTYGYFLVDATGTYYETWLEEETSFNSAVSLYLEVKKTGITPSQAPTITITRRT